MTENNIKLVNENGKIVGKDSESGETVPIELGETIAESLSTEVARTEEEPVFNVKYWGATGDGSTDDLQAIKDAFDAAADVDGHVFFPIPGQYYHIDGTLDLTDHNNVSVSGAGYGAHIRQSDDADGRAIRITSDYFSILGGIRVSNPGDKCIEFSGSDANVVRGPLWVHDSQGGNGDGVNVSNTTNSFVSGVIAWDLHQDGIHISGSGGDPAENVVVQQCYVRSSGIDNLWGGVGCRNTKNVVVKECIVENSEWRAYYIDDSENVSYVSCEAIGGGRDADGLFYNRGSDCTYLINPTVTGPIDTDRYIVNASGYMELWIPEIKGDPPFDELVEFQSDGRIQGGRIDGDDVEDADLVRINNDTVAEVSDVRIENAGDESNGLLVSSTNDVRISGCTFVDNYRSMFFFASEDIRVSDVRFENNSNDPLISDPDRVYWDGVIGGGKVGGINLSDVSGGESGDVALSDGSSGDADDADGTLWTWDGSEWVRSDGQAAITPS